MKVIPLPLLNLGRQQLWIESHPRHFLFPGEEAPIPKGGVKPTFTERPVIRQSEEEPNKIIFECRLVGEPRPEITWYHNEKQIVETDRHKYSMELDAKLYYLCRLEIANVDARDMGTYKAVARNASGEGNATINLTFEQGTIDYFVKIWLQSSTKAMVNELI